VQTELKNNFPDCTAYSLKYMDDEGDLCTLVACTFEDFLASAAKQADIFVLKMIVISDQVTKEEPPNDTPPLLQQRRTVRRRQQAAVVESKQVDDPRDLDELLQQFDIGQGPVKKGRKRKNRAAGKLRNQFQASESVHGDQDELKEISEHEADLAEDSQGDENAVRSVALTDMPSKIEPTEQITGHAPNEPLPRVSTPLQRSSSCPCSLPSLAAQRTAGASSAPVIADVHAEQEGNSSEKFEAVAIQQLQPAQSPFQVQLRDTVPWSKAVQSSQVADVATPTAEFGCSAEPVIEAPACGWYSPTMVPLQQEHPELCGYQQVMWMPILLPWPPGDYAMAPPIGMSWNAAVCH
jgi:hypothetical protein